MVASSKLELLLIYESHFLTIRSLSVRITSEDKYLNPLVPAVPAVLCPLSMCDLLVVIRH